MPAIKQSSTTAEGKGIPPVTHRAVLTQPERRPSELVRHDWAKKVRQFKRAESTKEKKQHG
jgi:hypothetical protein